MSQPMPVIREVYWPALLPQYLAIGTLCASSARLRAVTITVSSPEADASVAVCASEDELPAPSHKAEAATPSSKRPYRIPPKSVF